MLFGKKKKLGRVEREILETITAGDILIAALCSARSTRGMYKLAHERARARYRTRGTIDTLVKKGLARHSEGMLSVTNEGSEALENAVTKTNALLREKEWDGKWRMVAYDIPASHAKLRDAVRDVLKRAGFVRLQHSIWIFPHECRDLSEFIRSDRRLEQCVFYGVFEADTTDKRMRALFGL